MATPGRRSSLIGNVPLRFGSHRRAVSASSARWPAAPEANLDARRAKTKPIVDAFFSWCDDQAPLALDETPISRGIGYARNQREALERFLDDGRRGSRAWRRPRRGSPSKSVELAQAARGAVVARGPPSRGSHDDQKPSAGTAPAPWS